MNKGNKQLIGLLVFLSAMLGFSAVAGAAGPALSVATPTWVINPANCSTWYNHTWAVTNTSQGSEEIYVYLANASANNWTFVGAAGTPGMDQFDLRINSATGTRLSTSSLVSVGAPARDASVNLNLYLQTPPRQSARSEPHPIQVIVVARNWNYSGCPVRAGAAGYDYMGMCWWLGNGNESCTAACSRIASTGCLNIDNFEEKTICPAMTTAICGPSGCPNNTWSSASWYPGLVYNYICGYVSEAWAESSTWDCTTSSSGVQRCCPCNIR